MIIHVVQPGETIDSIARKYGKHVEDIILENELVNPYNLVVGQTITIVYPEELYTVQDGDTLESIANNNNISLMQLLRNNPYLLERELIPGENLVIQYTDEKISTITTFGYVFPFVIIDELRKSLPFLTYLTIYSYNFNMDGTINDIDDLNIIQIAKEYDTAPIMTISSFGLGMDIVHNILRNEVVQSNFLNNILNIVREKGYYGVNIDFFYITPSDRQLFVNFLSKISSQLKQEGKFLFVSLNISELEAESGFLSLGYYFKAIGEIADNILIISHSFYGSTRCIPFYFISYQKIKNIFNRVISQIPNYKIIIEIPVIGYIFTLPYVEGESTSNAISNKNAIILASQVGAVIYYDELNQVSSFTFSNDVEVHVAFNDERVALSYLELINDNGLQGIAVWTVMSYPPRLA